MNRLTAVLSVFFLLLSAAGSFAQEDPDKLKEIFQQLNNELAEMMLEGNHDDYLTYYADGAYEMPSYQPMIVGMEELKAMAEMQKENPMTMDDFELITLDVFGDGKYYTEIGTYSLNMPMPGMDGGWPDHGKYITVWEKQDDGDWKMKATMWNTDINPWEQMQQMQQEHGEGEHEEHHEEMEHEDDGM